MSTKPKNEKTKAQKQAASLLISVAEAQRILLRMSVDWLKHDKYDGLRITKLLEKHSVCFTEIKRELDSLCLVDSEDLAPANKIAGEPEGIDP